MIDHAELELSLRRRDADVYGIDLRFSRPDGETDMRLSRPGPAVAAIQPEVLNGLAPEEAGRLLGEQFLADNHVLAAVRQAQAAAGSLDVPLRVRLFIGPSAPELHGLRWELLQVPGDPGPLSTNENTLFSRYLSSTDWRPVHLRPERELAALVVAADPPGVEDFGLAKVEVDEELARARAGLGDAIHRTELSAPHEVSLNQIVDALRTGMDILYLIAHGVLVDGAPMLILAGDDDTVAGQATLVPGRDLIQALHDMQNRPRLVILASCQSAGPGDVQSSRDNGVLAALGPRLAEIGIPAVIAMQGNILMETMARFVPVFFEELRRTGHVDQAMAAARGAVRQQPDWWAPTLFMRLKSGRVWYTPGFEGQKGELEQWKSLIRNIERGKCTPILGPGLAESLLGSRQQIARRWARTFNFPMAPHAQDDLTQVTQFVAVNHGDGFARDELADYLRKELLQRIEHDDETPDRSGLLPDDGLNALNSLSLGELFSLGWKMRRQQEPVDPHWVLAQLPLPLYISTMPTNALFDALSDTEYTRPDGTVVKKQPRMEICKWNEDLEFLPSVRDEEPDYRPSPEEPLVYQLFGNLDEPDSVVLTEEDYFDFLIGATANKDLIPEFVRRYLVDSALLFLGFGIDEQDFRVLFRSVMNREGRRRRRGFAHVAVQVNLQEGRRILEPERAKEYLQTYFDDAAISIFWGSTDDFVRELQGRIG